MLEISINSTNYTITLHICLCLTVWWRCFIFTEMLMAQNRFTPWQEIEVHIDLAALIIYNYKTILMKLEKCSLIMYQPMVSILSDYINLFHDNLSRTWSFKFSSGVLHNWIDPPGWCSLSSFFLSYLCQNYRLLKRIRSSYNVSEVICAWQFVPQLKIWVWFVQWAIYFFCGYPYYYQELFPTP